MALGAEQEAAAESIRSGGYARFTNVLARQLLALGTGLSFPILTWGKLEGKIEEAEAHKRALDHQYETLKLKVESETRTAFLRLQNALQSIETRKSRATFAREAARLARARYQERLGSMVELTQAEANLGEAEASEVIGVYTTRVAESELRFAIGRR